MANLGTKWKIKFYIESSRGPITEETKKRKVPIYMYVTFGKRQRLQFYTREMILPDQIDERYLEKVKVDRHYFRPVKPTVTDSRTINGRLEKIAQETVRLIAFADMSDPPINLTAEYLKTGLKSWMDKDINPVKDSKRMAISSAMDEYKKYSLLHHAPKTVAGFKQVRDNIEAFISKSKKAYTYLSDIDQSFVDGFDAYLINKKLVKKDKEGKEVIENLSNNTYAKNLKVLKAFLRWCNKKTWYNGNVIIKYKENEGSILFLTAEELDKLQKAKFTTMSLERMRDVFIFGAFTALRYGDLKGLKKSDLQDGRIWFFEQKNKSSIQRNIKLMPTALAIVEKYKELPGEMLLPAYTDPNRKLKEVFKEAKIERMVKIKKTYAGGRCVEKTVPLSTMAHSHMERKTFITLAITGGMPEAVLKSITGHSKDSDSFKRYYDIHDHVKDDAMDEIFGNL